jgi:hypothetical protein
MESWTLLNPHILIGNMDMAAASLAQRIATHLPLHCRS